eukprot:11341337-Alexandrium_andersonii.AAC.1
MFAVPARKCKATACPGTSRSFCKCVTSGMMRSAIVHKCISCRSAAAWHALAGARLLYVLGHGCGSVALGSRQTAPHSWVRPCRPAPLQFPRS